MNAGAGRQASSPTTMNLLKGGIDMITGTDWNYVHQSVRVFLAWRTLIGHPVEESQVLTLVNMTLEELGQASSWQAQVEKFIAWCSDNPGMSKLLKARIYWEPVDPDAWRDIIQRYLERHYPGIFVAASSTEHVEGRTCFSLDFRGVKIDCMSLRRGLLEVDRGLGVLLFDPDRLAKEFQPTFHLVVSVPYL